MNPVLSYNKSDVEKLNPLPVKSFQVAGSGNHGFPDEKPNGLSWPDHGMGTRAPSRPLVSPLVRRNEGSWRSLSATSASGRPSS